MSKENFKSFVREVATEALKPDASPVTSDALDEDAEPEKIDETMRVARGLGAVLRSIKSHAKNEMAIFTTDEVLKNVEEFKILVDRTHVSLSKASIKLRENRRR